MAFKLTKKQQQYAVLGVIIGFTYFYSYFKYMLHPVNARIEKLTKELDEVNTQVDKVKRQAMRLPALQAEFESLKKELVSLEKKLPPKKDVSSIIKFVSQEAALYDIAVMTFSPGSGIEKDYYVEYPFELNVTARFHGLGHFFAVIGEAERVFSINNLKIGVSSVSQSGATTNASFTLKAYAYKS